MKSVQFDRFNDSSNDRKLKTYLDVEIFSPSVSTIATIEQYINGMNDKFLKQIEREGELIEVQKFDFDFQEGNSFICVKLQAVYIVKPKKEDSLTSETKEQRLARIKRELYENAIRNHEQRLEQLIRETE